MSKATIVSFHPLEIREHKPGMANPNIIIPAAPKNDFVSVLIEDNSHGVYLDSERGTLIVPEYASLFAEHVVNDFVSSQIGRDTESGAQPGIFWVEGGYNREGIKKEFPGKLAEAIRQQSLWFERLVKKADDDWTKKHLNEYISDLQRHAAKALNLDRDWISYSGVVGNERCPACSSILVNPAPPICPTCRCVLDAERASKLVFAKG